MADYNGLLRLTYANLKEEVQRFMGYGRRTTFAAMSSAFQGDVISIIHRGLRQFYYPPPLPGEAASHVWSFLRSNTDSHVHAPYTPTDTCTVVNGLATMSGGVLANNITQACAQFGSSGEYYDVTVRGSNVTFRVDNDLLNITTATAVTFYYYKVDLPDNFGGIDSQVTYNYNTSYGPLKQVNSAYIRNLAQSQNLQHVSKPAMFAIEPYTFPSATDTTPQSYRMLVYPFTDAALNLHFIMRVAPDELEDDDAQPLGTPMHAETVLVSCLAIAEEFGDTPSSKYRELFMQRLSASVLMDRSGMYPSVLGYNGDASDMVGQRQSRNVTVTYTP